MQQLKSSITLSRRGVLAIAAAAVVPTVIGLHAEGTLRVAAAPADPVVIHDPHVVIVKSKRIAYLLDGDRVVRCYDIDLGFAPVGQKRTGHDGRTPEGAFRVVSINPASGYGRFVGLNYPDRPAVQRGVLEGLISAGDAAGMIEALEAGRCPDWRTPLGGGIGIHGGGRGVDWTAGCVAVSDEAVEELFRVLRVGDTVEILP